MLPSGFQYSQSSMQDYVDCPRRFQLRYVESQPWPAVQAEPFLEYERHIERGATFHRLVERHQLGIPADVLESGIQDNDLKAWWRGYLGFDDVHNMDGKRYPELTLSADLDGSRLTATFDLLVVLPGQRIVIFDWKTYRGRPSKRVFASRLQTRVYPLVLCAAGAGLFGGPVNPVQVSMVYWVASYPNEPIEFEYSEEKGATDRDYLQSIIKDIDRHQNNTIWLLTSDMSRCKYCEYRSLCGRGDAAGQFAELDNNHDNIIDSIVIPSLEDVEEVGF
ncbi:MAG: PD-(D/E)XK nuclease family protein [Anaerolineae bacterium]|nr:PD-(D/E)XK nuclease family protein [Anaerolineae bacterium]